MALAHVMFAVGHSGHGDRAARCLLYPKTGIGVFTLVNAIVRGGVARDGEIFLYALLTVMNRMTAPWQLIRLGVKAAGSDTAARVSETHYGVAVNIVLAELERMVAELREDLRGSQGVTVGALLKTIHDSARGLRTELELPVDSTWGRTLVPPSGRRFRSAACGD